MTKLAAFLSALLTSAALAVGVSACVDDADGVGRLAPRSYDFEMEGFMYENSLAELFTACPDANWGWQTRWADVPEQPDWTVVQIELTGYVSDAHRLCLRNYVIKAGLAPVVGSTGEIESYTGVPGTTSTSGG